VSVLSRPKFLDKHARPHVVFGDYDLSAKKPTDPTRLQLALRLINALGVTGDYSGVDDTHDGTVEAWFSEASDAQRFADAIPAKGIGGRSPGYRSQRAFSYDARCYAKIQKALAAYALR
jgi:hypothetical protein